MGVIDIAIIGAGPAGLSAAIYARRAQKETVVFERDSYGGQIINTLNIENYPAVEHISGYEFASNLYNQSVSLGSKILFENVNKLENMDSLVKIFTNKNEYLAKTVIIATGAKNRSLNIKNEKEFIGKGVSYCALCDGAFYRKKDVAVVGGGNTAVEDALYLSEFCNKVYIVHRREEFRADEKEVVKLRSKKNVEFILNSSIIEINGDDKLEYVVIKNKDEATKTINIRGLFIAIGKVPDNECFSDIVVINEDGYIVAEENCKTNKQNIFVAGDNRTKSVRQLVTAASDGAVAASFAVKFLNNSN